MYLKPKSLQAQHVGAFVGGGDDEIMMVEMQGGIQAPIHTISPGQKVHVIDHDVNWNDIQNIRWKNDEVVKKIPIGKEVVGTRDAIYTLLENGRYLITPLDHVFMMSDKKMKRADRLTIDDRLMPANLQIQGTSDSLSNNTNVKGVWKGRYTGKLWNLKIGTKEAGIHGNFININGVVSADYTLQQLISKNLNKKLPKLGSPEYIKEYPLEELLQVQPSWKEVGELDVEFKPVEEIIVSSQLGSIFLPQKFLEPLPENAVYFVPKSVAKLENEDNLYERNQALPYELSDYLIRHYKKIYPYINFTVDWDNGTINASANPENKEVRLFGGLLRHKKLGIEGLSLIISHEVGHIKVATHKNEVDTNKNKGWTSCEGKADYWAASMSERQTWWGNQSLENIKIGAEQLNIVYTPLWRLDNLKPVQVNCEMHPAPACRMETFLAGLTGKPIPQCAKPLD